MTEPGGTDSAPRDAGGLTARLGRLLLGWVDGFLGYRPSRRVRRWSLAAAVSVFLVGSGVAIRAVELDFGELRWVPLLISAVVGVPLAALGGSLEYRAMARGVGAQVEMGRAFRIAVLASAANLLPLPGSVLVRVKALTEEGRSLYRSTAVTGVLGLIWIDLSAAIAGGFLLAAGNPVAGGAFCVGAAGLAIPILLLLRHTSGEERWARQILPMCAVEVFTIGVVAFRNWLVLLGLGLPATWTAAFVLPVAGSLTALVGFLPGGMGLREALFALVAPLAGLPPSGGFLVSALHRILGASTYALLAGGLLLAEGRSEPAA